MTFKKGHFYGLKRVFFQSEHQKTVSQGLLCVKRKSIFISTPENDFSGLFFEKIKWEKVLIFLTKIMD